MDRWVEGIPTIFVTRLFLFISLTLLIICLLQDLGGLTQLALFLIIFMYGMKIWSWLSSRGVRSRMEIKSRRTFPGKPLLLQIKIDNRIILPVRAGLWIKGIQPLLCGQEKPTQEGILFGVGSKTWKWVLKPLKRGVYSLGIYLYSSDLPGLYPKEIKHQKEEVEIIVYPRIHPVKGESLIPRQWGSWEVEGLIQDPINLVGTREYVPDRPARYINWTATARHHQLQENLFAPTGHLQVMLVLDVQGYRDAELFEGVLEGVASLLFHLHSKGYDLRLVTNGLLPGDWSQSSSSGAGVSPLPELLTLLARIGDRGEQKLVEIMEKTPKLTPDIFYLLVIAQEEEDLLHFFRQRGLSLTVLTPEEILGYLIKGDKKNQEPPLS